MVSDTVFIYFLGPGLYMQMLLVVVAGAGTIRTQMPCVFAHREFCRMWDKCGRRAQSEIGGEHTQINADGTIVNFVRHYCDCDVLLVKDGKDEREQKKGSGLIKRERETVDEKMRLGGVQEISRF